MNWPSSLRTKFLVAHVPRAWSIAVLLCGSACVGHAQTAPAIVWQKSLGGSGTDNGRCVQQTFDSGYVAAGSSNSNNGDVSGNHGGSDYWVVKLDASGAIQWQKSFGGTGDDIAWYVCQTSDSGFAVCGASASNNGDVSGNHGGTDYWIVKLSSTGGLQWQKSYGGTGDDAAYCVHQTSDGGYIISGNSYSNNGDVTGSHGAGDFWIVKLDANGALVWQKALGGSGWEWGSWHIQQTTDLGYITIGGCRVNNGDVTGNHGNWDYWIVRLDGNGAVQWQKSLGGSGDDYGWWIQQTQDGGFVANGCTSSSNGDVTGQHGGGYDYWTVRLSSTGTILWQKTLGGASDDEAGVAALTSDGEIAVGGWTQSSSGDVTSGNHGGYDYWIPLLDSNGVIQWRKSLGGSGDEVLYAIQPTLDNGFVVAGQSGSTNGDVTGNHGSNDYWVVKLAGVPGTPKISSLTSLAFGTLVCDTTRLDTLWVHNVGNKLLTISSSSILGLDASLFVIISPTSFPVTVPRGDSVRIIVRITTSAVGNKAATLSLVNDDPISGHNPWQVTLTARKEYIALSIPDTLRLDSVHAGTIRDTSVLFRTTGTLSDTITTVSRISGVTWIAYRFPVLPRAVLATAPTDTAQLRFRIIAPHDTGWFEARFRVHVEPCGLDSVVIIRVYLLSGIASVVATLIEDSLLCGGQSCRTYLVHNFGNGPLSVDSLRLLGGDAPDFGPITPASRRIVPPQDSQAYTICFTPRAIGVKTASLRVYSDDSISPANPLATTISGKKDSADFLLNPGLLDLGDVCVGIQHCDQLMVANTGTVTDTITRVTFAAGSGAFVIAGPQLPVSATAGGTQPVTVCFTPPDTGVFTATFAVYGAPCSRVHTFNVRGRGVRVDFAPLTSLTQFGDVRTGTCRDTDLIYVARGFGSLSLIGCTLATNNPAITIVSVTPLLPCVVRAGDTVRVHMRYCPGSDVIDTQGIQFNAVSPCTPTGTAAITGRGVSSALLISKSAVSLDTLPCGGSSMIDTAMLTNTGATDIHVVCSLAGANSAVFFLDAPASFTLAPSGMQLLRVRASAPSPGIWNALLIIASDDSKRPLDTVVLMARRDSVGIQVAPTTVNYGGLPNCLVPVDTAIILCNTGTVEEIVTASVATHFRVISAMPRHIAPSSCDTIIVRFAPTIERADLAEDLIVTTTPCGLLDTIHLRGRTDRYTFVPDSLDFGNTQVGDTIRLQVSIVNPNARPVRISRLSVLPLSPDVTSHEPLLPCVIAPRDSIVDTVWYAPTDTTGLLATLMAYVDAPCVDTIRCTLTGHGIKSDLSVAPRPLDFGTLDPCTIVVDSIQLCNRGTASITISSLTLGGTDATAFSLVNTPGLPLMLGPGACQWIMVECNGDSRPEGTWRAVLTITPLDPTVPPQTVNLQVVRRSPILAVPATVDFGTSDVGTGRDTTIVLHNRGFVAICVDTMTVAPEFTVTTLPFPLVLPVGDSLILRLRFAPAGDSSYSTAIMLRLTCPCADLKLISLFGTGVSQPLCTSRATLALDTVQRNVGDTVSIAPILLAVQNFAVCGASQFTWRMRYRRSLLVPIPLQGRDSAEWHIIDTIHGDTTGALPPVRFVATLGDTDVTPLYLETFAWSGGAVTTTVVNGQFKLNNVCPAGGKRLVSATGTFTLAQNSPNPFREATSIEYETIERGHISLRIVDLIGRTVATLVDQELLPGRYIATLRARAIPNGVYRYVLQSPSQTTGKMLILAE